MRKVVLSLAVLALAVSPVLAGKYNKKINIGDKAPSFEALQAVEGSKDTSVSLGDVKEDVVVVTFLATHCPVVVANEDRLIELAESFKGKSVKFIGICCTDDQSDLAKIDGIEGIKSRIKEKGYNFVYAYDPSGKTGRDYGAVVTPQIFVLDKDRVIRYTGAIDDSPNNEARVTKTYAKDAINALLEGKEIEVTETRATGCSIKYKSN